MSAATPPNPGSPRQRLIAIIAASVIITLVLGVGAVWFLTDRFGPVADGTLEKLSSAGSAGSWHAITPVPVGAAGTALAAGAATSFTVDRSAAGMSDGTVSVLVQLELTPGANDGGVTIGGGAESAASVSAVAFTGRTPVTVSHLVRLDDTGAFAVTSSADATATVTAFAYLQAPDGGSPEPGPGGTTAIAPRPVVDTATGLGATPAASGAALTLSPLGLGGVPMTGVQAVWLELSVLGNSASVGVGDAAGTPVVQSTGAWSNALVLVPLDDRGLLHWRMDGAVGQVRASLTGWVAGQSRTLDAATINGGLVPVAATPIVAAEFSSPRLPAALDRPFVGSALYSLQLSAPSAGTVTAGQGSSRADDRRETTLPVSGASTTLVIAGPGGAVTLPAGAMASSLTLLGYFPTPLSDEAAAPSIAITEPRSGGSVDLRAAGGTFTIRGTITADAGVRLIDVKLGSRSIGSATVDATTTPPSWSLETSAPPGEHEVTAVVTDWSGAQAGAPVTFSVVAPPTSDAVASNRTVVLADADLASVAAVTPTSITFAGPSPALVGEFLVAGVSPKTPEGVLREVTGVELVGGVVVVSTRNAAMADIVLQVDNRVTDQPLESVSAGTASADITAPQPPDDGGPAIAPASFMTGSAPERAPTVTAKIGPTVDVKATITLTGSVEKDVAAKPPTATLVLESKSANFSKSSSLPLAAGYQREVPASTAAPAAAVPTGASTGAATASPTASAPAPSKTITGSSKYSASVEAELSVGFTFVTKGTLDIRISVTWQWNGLSPQLDYFEASVSQVETKTTRLNVYGEAHAFFTATGKKGLPGSGAAGSTPTFDVETIPDVQLGRLVGVLPTPIPIPWTVLFQLRAELSFKADFTGTFTQLTTESVTRVVGIRFDHGTYTNLGSAKAIKSPTTWELDATLTLALDTGLYIDALLYGMVGAYLGVDALHTFTITAKGSGQQATAQDAAVADVNFHTNYHVKIDLVAGIKLTVMKRDLVDEDFPWTLSDSDVWNKDFTLDDVLRALAKTGDPKKDPATQTAVGTGNTPLLVILDTSGSMTGDKLATAKGALTDLVRDQGIGSQLGIWTYGGECDQPGNYVVPVQPIVGTGDLVTTIQGFTADGQTPTAEALFAATDQLAADGKSAASVVLVSDGESTCGDPCVAAETIRNSGFDLKVWTVGFQTSSQGETELQCVSGKTGGTYTSVTDVGVLASTLAELGAASLTLSVTAGDTVLSSQAESVEIQVTNPSARDATDVSVSLSFPGGDLVPVVAPSPQLSLGNVPAGGTVTRTVELSTPAGNAVGTTRYRVSAWGADVSRVVADGSYATVTRRAEAIVPGPILSDATALNLPVAILGDGMAAGAGPASDSGAARVPGTAEDETCHRTDSAYATALGTAIAPVVLACAGASANNLAGAPQKTATGDLPNQLDELAGQPAVSAVVLSAGAEDIGLTGLLARCLQNGCAVDSPEVRAVIGKAQELDLTALYQRVWATANTAEAVGARNGKFAPVVVLAYPQLFPENRGVACTAAWTSTQALAGETLIAYLNASLEAAAGRAAAAGYEVYFSAAPEHALLPNHSLCDDDPYVQVSDTGTLEPTATGFTTLADGLLTWSQSRERTLPEASAVAGADALAVPAPGVVQNVGRFLAAVANPGVAVSLVDAGGEAFIVAPDQQVTVDGEGYRPDSAVVVTLYGNPSVLGTATADANGRFTLSAIVPFDTGRGTATITAAGVGPDDGQRVLTRAVRVAEPVPGWIVLLLLAALVFALGAVGLGFVTWRILRPQVPSTRALRR